MSNLRLRFAVNQIAYQQKKLVIFLCISEVGLESDIDETMSDRRRTQKKNERDQFSETFWGSEGSFRAGKSSAICGLAARLASAPARFWAVPLRQPNRVVDVGGDQILCQEADSRKELRMGKRAHSWFTNHRTGCRHFGWRHRTWSDAAKSVERSFFSPLPVANPQQIVHITTSSVRQPLGLVSRWIFRISGRAPTPCRT